MTSQSSKCITKYKLSKKEL